MGLKPYYLIRHGTRFKYNHIKEIFQLLLTALPKLFPETGKKVKIALATLEQFHPDCRQDIPEIIGSKNRVQKRKSAKWKTKAELLACLINSANPKIEDDYIYKKAAKDLEQCGAIIQFGNDTQESIPFYVGGLGTVVYSKKQIAKMMQVASLLVMLGWDAVFVTYTFNSRQGTVDRIKAWREYPAKVTEALNYFSKHHGMLYMGVRESTKNGYPHAHIIMFFPKGTIKGYEKLQNRQVIKYGWLFNEIKKRSPAPQFKIEVARGKAVMGYLKKYISKSNGLDMATIAEKEGKLSDSEKKSVLSTAYIKWAGIRTFTSSSKKAILRELEREGKVKREKVEDKVAEVTRQIEEGKFKTRDEISDAIASVLDFIKITRPRYWAEWRKSVTKREFDSYSEAIQKLKASPPPSFGDFLQNCPGKWYFPKTLGRILSQCISTKGGGLFNITVKGMRDTTGERRWLDNADWENPRDWVPKVALLFYRWLMMSTYSTKTFEQIARGAPYHEEEDIPSNTIRRLYMRIENEEQAMRERHKDRKEGAYVQYLKNKRASKMRIELYRKIAEKEVAFVKYREEMLKKNPNWEKERIQRESEERLRAFPSEKELSDTVNEIWQKHRDKQGTRDKRRFGNGKKKQGKKS